MNQKNYLVSSEWLREQLNNSQIRVIDCRFQLANPDWGETEYNRSHIPGAYYLSLDRDLSSPVQLHGGRHPLPDINLLAQKFAELGIVQNETLVVAYDDARFAFASRLWWLLRYLGHDQVVLLDGGWNAWVEAGYPVTNEIPYNQSSGSFTPQPQTDWIVDRETIKAIQDQDSIILVDSRESDRYAGLREPIDPIAGSIPNAVNSPWKEVSDESGFLQSLEKQQSLWEKYQNAQEIIVYCGSGVTACVNLLSLELAGFNNAKLYPGGWSDWCSYLVD
jgi:thiosulfate/3-mercaptopyruvate sulfurtransferase